MSIREYLNQAGQLQALSFPCSSWGTAASTNHRERAG
jgi:hypothetical protein